MAGEGELGKVVSRFCLPDFRTVSIQEEVVEGGNYANTLESTSGEGQVTTQGTPRVGGHQAQGRHMLLSPLQ